MAAQKKYPDELRERAVKMVLEIRERDGKGRGELARVARQLGAAIRFLSSLDMPGCDPPSISACLTQPRSASG